MTVLTAESSNGFSSGNGSQKNGASEAAKKGTSLWVTRGDREALVRILKANLIEPLALTISCHRYQSMNAKIPWGIC